MRDSGGCLGSGDFFFFSFFQLNARVVALYTSVLLVTEGFQRYPPESDSPRISCDRWLSVHEDGGVSRVQSGDGDTSLLGPHDFFN